MNVKPRRAQSKHGPGFQAVVIVEILLGAFVAGCIGGSADMGMNKDHTVEELMAEIADSAAREADLRNRAEVAEAKLRHGDENVNPEVYRIEDGHPYEESFWPTLKEAHKCALCGSLEEFHLQVKP